MQADGKNAIPSAPSAFPQLSTLNPQPPQIPDHELLCLIGRGAYGEVWLARNAIGTMRAVKIVHRQSFQRAEHFEREFKGLLKFEPISRSHDGLVDVLQIGRRDDAGYFYYVMELADGEEMQNEKCKMKNEAASNLTASDRQQSILNFEFYILNYRPKTLRSLLRADSQPSTLNPQLTAARLPPAECITIGLKLASALEHLHANGLVHRDIKPSNIIFVDGEPKLADIGLVTAIDEAQSLVGTVGYIPPEGPGTPQADLYSLGKVLYEIALGKDRQDFPQLPPDLQSHPDYTALLELNEIILKACESDPRQRYASTEAMRADLGTLQSGQSVRHKRTLQRRWLAASKAGLVVALLWAIVVGSVMLVHRRRDTYVRSATPEVNELVDQGFYCVRDPLRLPHAVDLFKKAAQLDPTHVPAYWGLFQAAICRGEEEWNAPTADRQHIRSVAAKLKEIAPDRAEALAASSLIKWMDWKFAEALADARSATRLRADSRVGGSAAHILYGYYLLMTGQPAEALKEYLIGEKIDPASPISLYHLGHPYFVWRQFDQAMKYYQAADDLQPGSSRHFKGMVYEEKKDFMAAIQEFEAHALFQGKREDQVKGFCNSLREAVRQGGERGYWSKRLDLALSLSPADVYYIATLYARLGDKTNAYCFLRKACEQKAFTAGPLFDQCWDKNDPEFRSIVRNISLLQPSERHK